MNLLENYNLAEHQLNTRIKEVVEAKIGYKVHVQGFTAYADSVTASVNYFDSANQFISKDFELRIEDFEC